MPRICPLQSIDGVNCGSLRANAGHPRAPSKALQGLHGTAKAVPFPCVTLKGHFQGWRVSRKSRSLAGRPRAEAQGYGPARDDNVSGRLVWQG